MTFLEWLRAFLGIFVHARPEGWFVIVGFIVPFTLLAAYHLVQVLRHLHAERNSLSFCRDALKKLPDTAVIRQEEITLWLRGTRKNSVVAKAVGTIYASRSIPNPDLEAVATMLAQSEAARLGAVRGTPNRLLLFGLLGTVAGLASVVASLAPQIQGALQTEDPLVLTRNLVATIQQMQSAFACTAWGILAAVVIASAVGWVAVQQSNFLADVQEFGLRELAPRVFPKSPEAELEGVRNVLKSSQEFMERVERTMSGAASHFDQVLTGAGKAMTESVERLEQVATGMGTTLTLVAQEVKGSAETLKESAERLDESRRTLGNAYVELRRLFDEAQKSLENQAAAQLAKIGELQKHFGSSAQNIVQRVDSAAGKFGDAATGFKEAEVAYAKSRDETLQHMKGGFQELQEKLGGLLAEHRREMNLVEERLRQLTQNMGDLAVNMDPARLPKKEWDAVLGSLRACADELQRVGKDRVELQRLIERLLQGPGQTGSGVRPSPVPPDFGPSDGGALSRQLAHIAAQLDRIAGPSGEVSDIKRAVDVLCRTLQSEGVRVRPWWRRN